MKRANKPKEDIEVEKRSISASPELFEAAEKVMKVRHMTNFSEYVRSLVLRDLAGDLEPAKPKA